MDNSMDNKYANRKRQIFIYVGKFIRLYISERQWFMLVMSGIIAFLVAQVVGRNVYKTMEGTLLGGLAIACVCLWNGVFNSIQIVCKERGIIKREHRSGLSITAYLASHMVVQLIVCALQSIIMIVVLILSNVHMPDEGLVTGIFLIDFFLTIFFMTYASDMLGLMVSCFVKDTTMAMTAMPFVLIVQLLFAGVAFPLSGNVAKLSNFTITKWGVSAICILGDYNNLPAVAIYNQVKQAAYQDDLLKAIFQQIDGVAFTQYMSNFSQKPEYVFSAAALLETWMVFLAAIVLFAVLGEITLKFIDKDKRA